MMASSAPVAANCQSFLAFDYGLKRTGVAVGNRLLGTASPQKSIHAEGKARFVHVAERIRADVDAQHFPRLPNLRCSISLGLAEPPQAGLGLREWSEVADQAMYRAKESGRNRIVWPEADAV